jgi:hypothetical protein
MTTGPKSVKRIASLASKALEMWILSLGPLLTYSGGQDLHKPVDTSAIPVGRPKRADILHRQPLQQQMQIQLLHRAN